MTFSRILPPRKAAALAAAGLLIFACNKSPTSVDAAADVSAKVAQAAAAVTGQDAPVADEAEAGKHLGFDTHGYPGDKKMHAWKNAPNAPYEWVGYYLPAAPCHKDKSWSGKRDTLVKMGWGLAVVYVGQQTWGRTPRTLTPKQLAALARKGVTCNADLLSADRGAVDAVDAIRKTQAEGFPNGSVIFLDLERTEKLPARMRDYYKAWVATILKDARFRPGIYVHSHNAEDVYDDVEALYKAAGLQETPRFWVASGRDFSTDKAPQDVGHDFAGMWQGVIDVVRRVANVALPIDINVSNWPSPSDVTD
ncbi:MAG TPA: glycoside hydrolase domain-containing protein [Gemmatimonadaceae bacterium]|nr:glycoside hydrolase domain-containing protein [Gemmatimonadaceae bacterium]